jgi:hypothetical protein
MGLAAESTLMKTRGVEKKNRAVLRPLCAALAFCLFGPVLAPADTRILVDAKIRDQPVKLGFDTGAEVTCLFQSTARRLGLAVTPPDPAAKAAPGRVLMGTSEECEFSLGAVTRRLKFAVYDPPQGISYEMDGFLAWYPLRDNVVVISERTQSVALVEHLPQNLASWTKWAIGPHKVLTIQISGSGGECRTILFDTGSPFGVELNTQRWQRWRAEHPDVPATPVAFFLPVAVFSSEKNAGRTSWTSRVCR